MDQVTTYTWTNIKAGFVATVLFLAKIARLIMYGDPRNPRDPRPPINPNNPPMDINPKLNLPANTLDKGKNVSFADDKGPKVLHSSPKDDLPIASSSSEPVIFGPNKPAFFDTIQTNEVLKK